MAKEKTESEIENPENVSNLKSNEPTEPTNDETNSSFDQIANSLADSQPEVQQHAIDHEAAKQEEMRAEYADLVDSDGNSFDPNIHKTNKNGEPTLSTKGKLIKKPGRKKGDGGNSQSVIGGLPNKTEQKSPEQQAKLAARASGAMAANLLITVGVIAGGDEWVPKKLESVGMDEKSMLEMAFADYFEATGRTDIPPGLALTAAIFGYALPRFAMPKTQSRLGKFKEWVVKKWADRKLKKHGLKAQKISNRESRD